MHKTATQAAAMSTHAALAEELWKINVFKAITF
jgi:hypothetical protein